MSSSIDQTRVREWLHQRRLLGPKRHEGCEVVDDSSLARVRWFAIPNEAHTKILLGEVLGDVFAGEEEVLVYVDGWGEPPDYYTDPNLFNRFRQALGSSSTVQEEPGQLFYPADHADLVSMLRLMLWFGWGTYVISSSGRLVLRILDCDIGTLWAADPAEVDGEKLERLDNLTREDEGNGSTRGSQG
jgi:hypothetical protein